MKAAAGNIQANYRSLERHLLQTGAGPCLIFGFGASAPLCLSRRRRSSNTFVTVGPGYLALTWTSRAVPCNSTAVTARLPCDYLDFHGGDRGVTWTSTAVTALLPCGYLEFHGGDGAVTSIAHMRFSRHSLPQSTQRHHLLGNAPSLCFDNALDPLRQALAQTFDIIILVDEIRTALDSSSVLLT